MMDHIFKLPIHEHWMNKNYTNGRSEPIRRIVIHHNAGHGVDPWQTWQTREASAHFQVWSNGKVDQLVHLNDTAWHAHEANNDSIGIEHENESTGGNWPIADAALHTSAQLIGYLCARFKLGVPELNRNITTHNAVESDGIGVDTATACPGPYFLNVLRNPDHWYWKEARQAHHDYNNRGEEDRPKPQHTPQHAHGDKIHQGADVPSLIRKGSGQYLGLYAGPSNSHGGYFVAERPIIKKLQQRLIDCGFVPGVDNVDAAWADGIYGKPTAAAVERFQRKHMPHTQYFGRVYYDDWHKLFNL